MERRGRAKAVLGTVALVTASLVVALAVAEAAFALLLSRPGSLRRLPANVLGHLRAYHIAHERTLLQALPECARYDPEVFYTLRPGTCRFTSREFDTVVRVNRAGLRDDEASLEAPEVVVAGDSFALGWGVAAEESFPSVLERLTGRRVLNAGVPSFGTVREMRLLDRLDTSALRWLVVQYADNDARENWDFFRWGHLPVSGEELFTADVQRRSRPRRYWPGKIAATIVRSAVSGSADGPGLPPDDQARHFVNALGRGTKKDLSGVEVIVLQLSGYHAPRNGFEAAVLREASRSGHPEFVRRLSVLELWGTLGPDDFMVLDDHLNARGHGRLAERLAERIPRR